MQAPIIVTTEHFVKQCFEIVSFGIINLTAKESIIANRLRSICKRAYIKLSQMECSGLSS